MYKFLKGLVSGGAKADKTAKPIHAHRVTLMGRPQSYVAPEKSTILLAAVNAGIPFPHNCGEGFCGSCRCKIVSGRYELTGEIEHLVNQADQDVGYTLACKTRALSDVTVSFEPDAAPVHASVIDVTPMTQHVSCVRLALDVPLIYRNGQFVNLKAGGLSPRPYSIVTPYVPGAKLLDFHVSTKGGGAFASWVATQAKAGDRVEIAGPHGNFIRPAERKQVVLIAGGSGAGVLWGMVSGHSNLDVTVIAVTNRQGHFYLRDGFLELGRAQPVNICEVAFDAEADDGYSSLAQQAAATAHAQIAAGHQPVFLICGSEALVRSTHKALLAAGVAADSILSDVFAGREAVSRATALQ